MKTSDFYYDLPKELIAQSPAECRSASRLLVYNRATKSIEDKVFSDIIDYLNPGDVLVRNTTRVIPARLYGTRPETGGKMEFLLLRRIDEKHWECLVKPGRRAKVGLTFKISDELSATVTEMREDGNRIIRLNYDGIFEEILNRAGEMPLPPYITERLNDKTRYQTVYAKENGSAAAPTAGLHFTDELLSRISEKGIDIVDVLLHVGLGTFRPVKVDNVLEHHMHTEFYQVTQEAADKINRAKAAGNRVICVGTTSCRTVESAAEADGHMKACSGNTDIFIYPGYKFKVMDGLITNFHLPESTLVMLVSAFAGRDHVLKAYEEAVKEKYRFFSFGDAMFIADLNKEGVRAE